MVRRLLFVVLALLSFNLYAQSPQGINYQGVARDSEGKPIASTGISVRISVLKNSAAGEIEYAEVHELQTNQFGLFTLVIGRGTVETGTFGFISWAVGSKWLQIEIDPDGGRSFELAGSQQLMSVPYAFYSEYSGNGLTAGTGISISNNRINNTGDGDSSPTNETITDAILTSDGKLRITEAGITKEVDLSSLSGGLAGLQEVLNHNNNAGGLKITNLGSPQANTDAATKAYVDAHVDGDGNATNEIQDLSLVGNNLSITNNPTATPINLAPYLNTDSQNLSLGTSSGTNRIINISGGTGVTVDVADNDNNATNEIQTLTKAGALVSLSLAGGSFTLNDDSPTNEIQDLTLNPSTNSLSLTSDGTPVDLTPYKQTLSYTPGNNNLTISGSNTVAITHTLAQVLTTDANASGLRIQNVGTPTATTDATTKGYVDTAIATAIATNYAFKSSFNFQNLVGVFNDSPIALTDVFDDFNVIGSNRFTAPTAGVYSFTVTGTSSLGGVPIKLRIISGTTSLYDIKRATGYPLATIINYYDSNVFKLNAGDTVELVVTSLSVGERVEGLFFGSKL